MDKEVLSGKEIGSDRNVLVYGLDFGIGGSNVENLAAEINIPYSYLSSQQRRDLSYVIKNYIRPNVRDKIRQQKEAGIMGKEIAAFREQIIPDRYSIPDFWSMVCEADVAKMNLHYRIADFLKAEVNSKIEGRKSLREAQELFKLTKIVEPRQLALSSRIKDFLENYLNHDIAKLPLSPEDILLISTPSLASYPVMSGIDFLRYRLNLDTPSEKEEEKRLLKLYFNDDYEQFAGFRTGNKNFGPIPKEDKKIVERYINETLEQWQMFRSRKLYFLLERQVRYAREADNLLILDNCFDGYNISKEWFHHDLFLKIFLISKKEHLNFTDLVDQVKDKAKELVFYPEERLLDG